MPRLRLADVGHGRIGSLKNFEISPPVILISGYIDVSEAVTAMNVGAETVLRKPYRDHELWDAIQRAINRDAQLRLETDRHRESAARFAGLTAGETAVLELITGGDPNKVAARRLGISLRTVYYA